MLDLGSFKMNEKAIAMALKIFLLKFMIALGGAAYEGSAAHGRARFGESCHARGRAPRRC